MIPEYEIILRLGIAAVLGAVVGYERERHNQPAGLRTHMILVVGSALAMTLSINLAMQFRPDVPNGDPARLAAQVLSGIGFLGAGAILRLGTNVRGLTTATSLWSMAVVGLSVGAGYYLVALAATALLILALSALDVVEKHLIHSTIIFPVQVVAGDEVDMLPTLREILKEQNMKVQSFSIQKDLAQDVSVLDLVVQAKENSRLESLVEKIHQLPGVRSYKVG
ncbi:MAG TPA: MgtC/SapB family protein [Anaerolineaceae bacterium]|nr:MgtC/SapB family protein [Anaerolineaceae bacterium]HQO97297.1 MgtC/SapB family protein [Anaerolineaceae bacterium]HQP60958.1 MgtC/SapB family protein [Anaerolineaceae bacterium]